MRTAGIGALGLLGGVLVALIAQDLIATAFIRSGTVPIALALGMGLLMPVLGALGAVVAIVLDHRATTRRSKDGRDG